MADDDRFIPMAADRWKMEIENAIQTAKAGRTENDRWFRRRWYQAARKRVQGGNQQRGGPALWSRTPGGR